ncbi:MAG: gamma-glutamyl-gamma-aminobutyrate hydrolase family protein [Terracoccus sp.]
MTTARRPVVGISAYAEDVDRGAWGAVSCRVVPTTYVEHVEAAGGLAVLLPCRADADASMVEQVVGMLDALVLVGGGDVAGAWFGEEDHPSIGPVDVARDEFEIRLARAAIASDLPMLGVCRGMQVMAVAAGGTVEQHIPDRTGDNLHGDVIGGYHEHVVRTVPGTVVADLVGETMEVSCHHHQGVGRHPGFVASAWSGDPTLEAMEAPGARFRVGIQSHPETRPDSRFFEALVAAAEAASNPTIRTGGSTERDAVLG